MTFLNFSQLPESVFRPNFLGKYFPETKPIFSLTGKCFPLTNFSNGKQIQESLENDFPETTFRKTNTTKRENTFLETKPNFSLTGKCFRWPTFLMTNKHRKVWKVVFQKLLFSNKTWPWKEKIVPGLVEHKSDMKYFYKFVASLKYIYILPTKDKLQELSTTGVS